jgi:hypothetical protein
MRHFDAFETTFRKPFTFIFGNIGEELMRLPKQ